MPKYTQLPALSGKQLLKLLRKDDWIPQRRTTHGVALAKHFGDRSKVTVIPDTSASLDDGTLGAILGCQTNRYRQEGLTRFS